MKPSNILKIESLDKEWKDKDSVILHACFQLLKDFVEKEYLVDSFVDWDHDESHRQAKKEIEELYQWWLSYHAPSVRDETIINLENKMLIRLINIRSFLWT